MQIEKGQVNLNPSTIESRVSSTPLFCASFRGYLDIMQLLVVGFSYSKLDAKADANPQQPMTPLHGAARHRDGQTDLLLKYGANANAQDSVGQTPLHVAAYEGNLDSIQALVEAKADLNCVDSKGATALLTAASLGNPSCALYLVKVNLISRSTPVPRSISVRRRPP